VGARLHVGFTSTQGLLLEAEDLGVRSGIPESLIAVELPDDLLGSGLYLDEERLTGASVAIADDPVSIREHLERRHPREGDSRQIGLTDGIHDRFLRADLENAMPIPGRDERISVRESQSAKEAIAVALGTMSRLWFSVKERNLVLPDHLAGLTVVLTHLPIGLMSDEVVAVVDLPNEASIGVGIRVVDDQLHFVKELSLAIDLDDPRRPGLRDHQATVRKGLESVDLDSLTVIAILLTRVVLPNGLLRLRVDLDDLAETLGDEEMAILEDVDVMDTAPRSFPFDGTIAGDDREAIVPLNDQSMALHSFRRASVRSARVDDEWEKERSEEGKHCTGHDELDHVDEDR
jgi:hypothetical protein